MIIDCPIAYTASVVPPRKRNAVTHKLTEFVPIEIREVTGDDAPVALWWSPGVDPNLQESVRAFDGELYRPYRWSPYAQHKGDLCTHPDGLAAVRPIAAAEGLDWYVSDRGNSLPPIGFEAFAARLAAGTASPGSVPGTHDAPDGTRIQDVPTQKVLATNLDLSRRQWQAAASELLAVDGVLFHKAPIPLYVVKDTWRDPVLSATWSDGWDVQPEHAFCATDWEGAAARLRTLRGERHRPEHDDPASDPMESHLSPRPDILRPDLIPAFDVGEFVIRGTGESIVKRLEMTDNAGWSSRTNAPTVTRYDRPVLMAYAHLRDACRAGADPAEVVARLTDLSDACSPHGTLRDLNARIVHLKERIGDDLVPQADLDAFVDLGAMP